MSDLHDDYDPTKAVVLDMRGCARCHADHHPDVRFEPLTFPVELEGEGDLTHWAACPTNGQPILLRVTPDE